MIVIVALDVIAPLIVAALVNRNDTMILIEPVDSSSRRRANAGQAQIDCVAGGP